MILAALAFSLALTSGRTEEAAPNYAVGDAFVWSNGRIEKVRRLEGDQIVWSGLTGRPWRRSINFVAPIPEWRFEGRVGRRTVMGDISALWPLRSGRSVQFRVVSESRPQSGPPDRWDRSVALWTCQVGAAKTVTVEAGAFSAIPIICDRFSPTVMRPVERMVWDFAPDVGHFIRRVTTNYRDGRQTTVKLVAALHGPAATDERLESLARPYRPRPVAN